eukprot:Trichotokara_eunicae@DN5982_c0_g1_i1.p1
MVLEGVVSKWNVGGQFLEATTTCMCVNIFLVKNIWEIDDVPRYGPNCPRAHYPHEMGRGFIGNRQTAGVVRFRVRIIFIEGVLETENRDLQSNGVLLAV